MADWLGKLLGQLPSWLFLPALIIVIVAIGVWYYLELTVYAPSRKRSKKEK